MAITKNNSFLGSGFLKNVRILAQSFKGSSPDEGKNALLEASISQGIRALAAELSRNDRPTQQQVAHGMQLRANASTMLSNHTRLPSAQAIVIEPSQILISAEKGTSAASILHFADRVAVSPSVISPNIMGSARKGINNRAMSINGPQSNALILGMPIDYTVRDIFNELGPTLEKDFQFSPPEHLTPAQLQQFIFDHELGHFYDSVYHMDEFNVRGPHNEEVQHAQHAFIKNLPDKDILQSDDLEAKAKLVKKCNDVKEHYFSHLRESRADLYALTRQFHSVLEKNGNIEEFREFATVWAATRQYYAHNYGYAGHSSQRALHHFMEETKDINNLDDFTAFQEAKINQHNFGTTDFQDDRHYLFACAVISGDKQATYESKEFGALNAAYHILTRQPMQKLDQAQATFLYHEGYLKTHELQIAVMNASCETAQAEAVFQLIADKQQMQQQGRSAFDHFIGEINALIASHATPQGQFLALEKKRLAFHQAFEGESKKNIFQRDGERIAELECKLAYIHDALDYLGLDRTVLESNKIATPDTGHKKSMVFYSPSEFRENVTICSHIFLDDTTSAMRVEHTLLWSNHVAEDAEKRLSMGQHVAMDADMRQGMLHMAYAIEAVEGAQHHEEVSASLYEKDMPYKSYTMTPSAINTHYRNAHLIAQNVCSIDDIIQPSPTSKYNPPPAEPAIDESLEIER